MARRKPNILITGTPGVGKSLISMKVCKLTGLKPLNISKFAMSKNLILEHDNERNCGVIDEDQVVSKLKKRVMSGGLVIEYHSCEFFPSDWFDKIFVLRVDNSILHGRLTERGYSDSKVTENIECEIFQVALEEAYETFGRDTVIELQNNDKKQLRSNIKLIVKEVEKLQKEGASSNDST